MKKYDFNLAVSLVRQNMENLSEATLGIHEDWAWTAHPIWDTDDGFLINSKTKKVMGIDGSNWGTPVLELRFKDSTIQIIECFYGESKADELKKIEKSAMWASGPISAPIQEIRDEMEVLTINSPKVKSLHKLN